MTIHEAGSRLHDIVQANCQWNHVGVAQIPDGQGHLVIYLRYRAHVKHWRELYPEFEGFPVKVVYVGQIRPAMA